MLSDAQEYRKKLVEKIAESEDTLLEKYLEGGELTEEEIIRGIKEGSLSRRVYPCCMRLSNQKHRHTSAHGCNNTLPAFSP